MADAAKEAALACLEALGRYRAYRPPSGSPSGPPVAFEGHRPAQVPKGVRSQTRLAFEPGAVSVEAARDVVYTRFGQAWVAGRLIRQYSAKSPSFLDLAGPAKPAQTLERATIVQSFLTATYGDWIGEHLSSLIAFGCPAQPLALPGFLEERAYVRRDCERLGLEVVFIDDATLIRDCFVLPKVRPGNYFTREDPSLFCRAFGVTPAAPRPGSMVYLTRRRAASHGPARRHPFAETAAAMAEIGARIIDTDDMTFEDWAALGADAETVIADHGAALFNMMYWRPRCAIEFFSSGWWNNSFLFVGEAVGVERHFLFNTDGLDCAAVAGLVTSALAAFRSGKPLGGGEGNGADPRSAASSDGLKRAEIKR